MISFGDCFQFTHLTNNPHFRIKIGKTFLLIPKTIGLFHKEKTNLFSVSYFKKGWLFSNITLSFATKTQRHKAKHRKKQSATDEKTTLWIELSRKTKRQVI
jgi:hypothetical protein